MRPASGIASRALITRLSIASSIWLPSLMATSFCPLAFGAAAMQLPAVCCSRSTMPASSGRVRAIAAALQDCAAGFITAGTIRRCIGLHHSADHQTAMVACVGRLAQPRQHYVQVLVAVAQQNLVVTRRKQREDAHPISRPVGRGRLAGRHGRQHAQALEPHQAHHAVAQRHQPVDPLPGVRRTVPGKCSSAVSVEAPTSMAWASWKDQPCAPARSGAGDPSTGRAAA